MQFTCEMELNEQLPVELQLKQLSDKTLERFKTLQSKLMSTVYGIHKVQMSRNRLIQLFLLFSIVFTFSVGVVVYL